MLENFKTSVQIGVRNFHVGYCNKGLPDRIAIFFHSVKESELHNIAQLCEYFKNDGYEFVSPENFHLDDGNKKCFVSFDDNFLNWMDCVRIFERYNVQAAFYINPLACSDISDDHALKEYFTRLGYSSNIPTLSTSDIKHMAELGHTIGNHTLNHYNLAAIPANRSKVEISKGKELLEEITGKQVLHFSYPYGMTRHITKPLIQYCFDIGIRTIATGVHGMHHACSSRNMIHRTAWRLDRPIEYNLENLSVDGRLWHRLTARNAVI